MNTFFTAAVMVAVTAVGAELSGLTFNPSFSYDRYVAENNSNAPYNIFNR